MEVVFFGQPLFFFLPLMTGPQNPQIDGIMPFFFFFVVRNFSILCLVPSPCMVLVKIGWSLTFPLISVLRQKDKKKRGPQARSLGMCRRCYPRNSPGKF